MNRDLINSREDGPDFPVGSLVTLAKEQHPKVTQCGDSEVLKTYYCEDRKCWMHTVKFHCDRMENSFPPLWLKRANQND